MADPATDTAPRLEADWYIVELRCNGCTQRHPQATPPLLGRVVYDRHSGVPWRIERAGYIHASAARLVPGFTGMLDDDGDVDDWVLPGSPGPSTTVDAQGRERRSVNRRRRMTWTPLGGVLEDGTWMDAGQVDPAAAFECRRSTCRNRPRRKLHKLVVQAQYVARVGGRTQLI